MNDLILDIERGIRIHYSYFIPSFQVCGTTSACTAMVLSRRSTFSAIRCHRYWYVSVFCYELDHWDFSLLWISMTLILTLTSNPFTLLDLFQALLAF